MDLVYLIRVVAMGIVEGVTEFLPVSSTGHLIIASEMIRFTPADKEMFIVAIQAGAMLAVMWHYRVRIGQALLNFWKPGIHRNLAVNTVVGFLPAAVLGVMLAGFIQSRLFNVTVVGTTLVLGGLVILWLENRNDRLGKAPRVAGLDDLRWLDALKVGFMQCLAMIPGTSRSGATIIGGMVCGLSRKAATEFSFFLALPTIIGASVYDVFKTWGDLGDVNLVGLALGTAVSFLSALAVVRWLLGFVAGNDFRGFGWYRILFGLLVLALAAAGLIEA